jgi:molybdate transport system regulatory protein
MSFPTNPPAWVDANLSLSGIDRRMIALLQSIDECGSISQAARQCGLSYKGAWQVLERANNCAPRVLVSTAIGGSKGGGAKLTETGRDLLDLFARLEGRHRDFLAELNRELAQNPDAALLLQRLAVKTCVRNQLFGTVSAITPGAVQAQIRVDLAGRSAITVSISRQCLDEFELKLGDDAVLLINDCDIVLLPDGDPVMHSASNSLTGSITRIQLGDINAEVSLLLPGGEILTAVITRDSCQKLALKPGMRTRALFKANAPVLGLRSQ